MFETFLVSFVVILLCCGGLAIGQYFGRDPIRGRCSPDNPQCCGASNTCSLRGRGATDGEEQN